LTTLNNCFYSKRAVSSPRSQVPQDRQERRVRSARTTTAHNNSFTVCFFTKTAPGSRFKIRKRALGNAKVQVQGSRFKVQGSRSKVRGVESSPRTAKIGPHSTMEKHHGVSRGSMINVTAFLCLCVHIVMAHPLKFEWTIESVALLTTGRVLE